MKVNYNCYWCARVKDMGANIPWCTLYRNYCNNGPCIYEIEKEKAEEIAKECVFKYTVLKNMEGKK